MSGTRDQGSVVRGQDDRGAAAATGQEVDWLVGAALLARARVSLAQVGGFDEGYFMYSEELDLVPAQSKTAGWRIGLPADRSRSSIYEGKSSEQVVAARHIRFQTSKVRYFRKFHGRGQAGGVEGFHPGLICGRMAVGSL